MQAIIFNITGSNFDRHMEAAALRIAYLLGSRPVIAGDTGNEIYFTKVMSGLSPLMRLQALAVMHKNDPETEAVFQDMYKKMNAVAHVKPKTKEQFKARREMENSVNKCFIPTIQNMQNFIDSCGFGVIRELKDDKVFGYLPTNINPETADQHEIITSELMQLLVVEDDEEGRGGIYDSPELFFFGNDFMSNAYAKPAIFSTAGEEACNMANAYLHHCFTFPPVNELTADDMQAVRSRLHERNHEFNKVMDEWCYRCYDHEASHMRLSVFRNEILPEAARLQQALQADETLQRCRSEYKSLCDIEVWIGELPVLSVWQYYRDFDVLKDETWQKLEELKTNPDFQNQRWPVMMLKTNGVYKKSELSAQQPAIEIMPVKKYLLVD